MFNNKTIHHPDYDPNEPVGLSFGLKVLLAVCAVGMCVGIFGLFFSIVQVIAQ